MKSKYLAHICFFISSIACSQVSNDTLAKLKRTADSLYDSQASYHLSLKVFLQLDSLLKENPSSDLAFYTGSRIAKNYNAIDNSEKAIAYSKNNLIEAEKAENSFYRIDALLNLVVSHTLKREFDTALEYYEKSEKLISQHYSSSLDMDAKNALDLYGCQFAWWTKL